ncbi:MAG: undecaprenyl-diphosphate phosphatase [Candidatus Saganbacteria bacterium]|nr:undecaprenyl-diphosphate phosphatase [Candidatus Saganbacteria bacterium]
MNLGNSILLGIVQGATEFLPVSSSGHLVIFSKLLGLRPSLTCTVLLHLASLLAVFLYFYKDIIELGKNFFLGLWQIAKKKEFHSIYHSNTYFKMSLILLCGSFFTGIIGLLLKKYVIRSFESVLLVGAFLLVTAIIILIGERLSTSKRFASQLNFVDALIIGITQGIAVFPGISRSGACISASLARGFDRKLAARFSFLISIPAILGSGLIELNNLIDIGFRGNGFLELAAGFLAAFIFGYLSIKIFMDMIQRTSIRIFAYYCAVVGTLVIIWSII